MNREKPKFVFVALTGAFLFSTNTGDENSISPLPAQPPDLPALSSSNLDANEESCGLIFDSASWSESFLPSKEEEAALWKDSNIDTLTNADTYIEFDGESWQLISRPCRAC